MSKRWYIRYGLKEFLLTRNRSTDQVVQQLEIEESVLLAWHQGLKDPNLADLTKFANFFEVDFCYDLHEKGFYFTERKIEENKDTGNSQSYTDNHHYAEGSVADSQLEQMQETIDNLRKSISSVQKELIRLKLKVDSLLKPLDGDIELQNFFKQTL